VQNSLDSPLFNAGIDFKQGGTDLGNTQYIDAYQRGNFWSSVSANSSYHVLLGTPSVAAEQTITVSNSQGKVINNPFGSGKVGEMNINSFDSNLQSFMKHLTQINPGVLPIFLTYDIYLTSGGCCIGGYHSANGAPPTGQTYAPIQPMWIQPGPSPRMSRHFRMKSANGWTTPLSTTASIARTTA
jgi:hypothetical protein